MPASELLQQSLALWRQCPLTPPPWDRTFTPGSQAEREARLEEFLAGVEAELRSLPRTRAQREATRERIASAFVRFSKSAMDLEDHHLDLLLGGGFSAIGSQLARRAREFDPSVSTADILQASRNTWTACGLQVLLGRTMHLTPSIFAYSMLYPYTDNYLDDPNITREEKVGFSARFGGRLKGEAVEAANSREAAIWRLIGLIEEEFPRAAWPQVFEGLLAIHRAQEKSIRLLRHGLNTQGIDVLTLSFEKGGTSVLADGILAAGSLTPSQAQFVFDWGVLLQLADDLQDVRQDCRDGMLTVFSGLAGREPLDGLTNRTLHFAQLVMERMEAVAAPGCQALKELIVRSSRSLVIRSAGDAPELYTKECLAELEARSPFRFSFLATQRRQMEKRRSLLVQLFEVFLEGEEDEPAFPLLPSSLLPRF
jgi:hypothetical protein